MEEWRERAACLGEDPGLFFPESPDEVAAPLALCAGCDVQAECLDYALHAPVLGVWGGRSERARMRLRRDLGIRAVRFDLDALLTRAPGEDDEHPAA